MKRNRNTCYRNLLALLAPLVFLLAAETFCRVAGLGHPTRFLIQAERNGEDVWIDNQLFGYRYFSPAVSRAPAPIVLPREKGENELRVVLLGESAAMGEPEPAYGPARMLELILQEQLPDRDVTVINAAMTAINSHVIREIAHDLKRMQPDYVICYIGNNEVVGPFGPGTAFGSFSSSQTANRLRSLITRLRLASVVRSAWHRFSASDDSRWQGMEMFTDFRVEPDDPRLQAVYDHYQNNLAAIIDQIKSVNARPVLSTVSVNLANQAPLDGKKPSVFESNAPSLDAYKNARDADSLRFRADSKINEAVKSVAAEKPAVILVDAEAAFEQNNFPGNNLFLDHVHFNLSGSYKLALLLSDAVIKSRTDEARDAPGLKTISERIGWNPYNSLEIAEIILERLSRPPFTLAIDYETHLLNWTKEVANIHRQIRKTPADDVLRMLLDTDPKASANTHNIYLAIRVALFEDRFTEAGVLIKQLRNLLPHRADVRSWDIIIAALNGTGEDPWELLTDGAPDLGEIPADMLISASETLFLSNYGKESVAFLRLATKHFPHRTRAQGLLATRLAQTGEMTEALSLFERLHNNNPDANWINEEYGLLLALNGKMDQAERLFAHLQNETDPDQRLKYIQFLLYKRDVQTAIRDLEAVIESRPDHAASRRMYSYVLSQSGRPEEALEQISKAIELEPWNGVDLARQGSLYDTLNDPARAVAAYESALEYLTDPIEVMRSMSWILATHELPYVRNPKRALRNMKRLVELFPKQEEDPYTLYVLATAMAANNQYEAAAAEIDKALQLESKLNHRLANELQQAGELFKQGKPITINRD